MNKTILSLTLVLSLSSALTFAQRKEVDNDINYDEARIPHYDLPELLVTSEGKTITTADEWHTIRRPQIMSMFGNLIYGTTPKPESPIKVEFEVVKEDKNFMGSKATRKDVAIRFSNNKGTAESLIIVFSPNNVKGSAPAIMKHSFNSTHGEDFDVHEKRGDRLKNGWPLGDILDAGLGFIAVYQNDLVSHNEVDFNSGIAPLFYKTGQSFPKASEWGCLSIIAWGGMRALDYLETDNDIDAKRVAIMGHSKMGKTALWTAAQDQRFALAISAQSGCAGAALWRRKSGETLEKMVTRFPYWLSRNAWKFVNQEDDMPVDQHMLLACIAPRPVYIHSSIGDTWADSRGEYLSAYHASPVYELLGKKGLTSEASPEVGEPIMKSDVGYHTRNGDHTIQSYDWDRFIEFTSFHLVK